MGGICIVEERRLNEAGNIDDNPEDEEKGERRPETMARRNSHQEPKPPTDGGNAKRLRFRCMRKESVSCSSERPRDASRLLTRKKQLEFRGMD
jgi:hypothetical protein